MSEGAQQQVITSIKDLPTDFIKKFIDENQQNLIDDNDIILIKNNDIKKITESINTNELKILAGIKLSKINTTNTNNLLINANNYIYLFAFKRKALYAFILKKNIDELEKIQDEFKKIQNELQSKLEQSKSACQAKNANQQKLEPIKQKLKDKLNININESNVITKIDNLSNQIDQLKKFVSESAKLHDLESLELIKE